MRKIHFAAVLTGVIAVAMCGAGCEGDNGVPPRPVNPGPAPRPAPRPNPRPGPSWPNCTDAPQLEALAFVEAIGAFVGGSTHDGIHISCDLDPALHTKNVGGSDGAGLCVTASLRNIGQWQHNLIFTDLFEAAKSRPGGSWPSRVDEDIARLCRQYGAPIPDYVQILGLDEELIRRAIAAGLMVGECYNHSPSGRYSGQRIAHMVNLVHADGQWYVILDNNFPGGESYEWLTREEWLSTRPDWAIILLETD